MAPAPTSGMALHGVVLDLGNAVNHATHDTLDFAFAIALGAAGFVVPDGPFGREMRLDPDPSPAALLVPLDARARSNGDRLTAAPTIDALAFPPSNINRARRLACQDTMR
jgi:hypothetical protein